MSRSFHDAETDAWLRECIKDYANADIGVDWMMTVGTEDVSDLFDTANIAVTEDAPAWDLSTNIAKNVELRTIRRAPVKVRADFGGVLVDIFHGREDGLARHEGDYSTSFLATTPGSWLYKIPLGQPVEYNRRSPRWILRDALNRSPYYDRGNVQIAALDTPQLKFTGEDRFADDTYPANIIEAVREVVSFSHKDTPTRYGHRLREDVGTGEGRQVEWVFDAHDDREIVDTWVEPSPVAPEDQPTVVIAREYYDNGDIKIWKEAKVFSYGDKYPSPGIPKFIDFSTEDLDVDGTRMNANDAYRKAVAEARLYRNLEHKNTTVVSFNPYLWPDDVITFTSKFEISDRGFFRRDWRAVIEGMSHDLASPQLLTNLDYRCYLLRETRLPDPPIRLPGITAAVVNFDDITPLIEITDREIVFAPSVSWLSLTEKEGVATLEAPVTVTDREIILEET